ncbi:MAG: hypothetical protein V4521_02155 [Pseudomonadota bacterium]
MSDHAISNARAWAGTICEVMTAFTALESGEVESVEFDGSTYDDADDLRQRIDEMPLSVQVRGGWYTPGDSDGFDAKPEEFEILLSTGGPALRIYGKLNGYGSVDGAPDLEWQDWGTPWTTYSEETESEVDAICAFAACFWFGE